MKNLRVERERAQDEDKIGQVGGGMEEKMGQGGGGEDVKMGQGGGE